LSHILLHAGLCSVLFIKNVINPVTGSCTSYWTAEAGKSVSSDHRKHCWREDCGESRSEVEAR